MVKKKITKKVTTTVNAEDVEEDKVEDLETSGEEEKEDSKEEVSKEEDKVESVEKEVNTDEGEALGTMGGKTILIVAGLSVLIMFILATVISESDKFDYIGLTFQKERFGDIPIFTVHLTGQNIVGDPINFKLSLRENPKKSEIPVEGVVTIIKDSPVYLGIDVDSGISECGSTAMVAFGQFMNSVGMDLITGVASEDDAEEFNRDRITCTNIHGSTILKLTTGEESKITQTWNNCYVLTVNNCELNEVIERFEIAVLADMTGEAL